MVCGAAFIVVVLHLLLGKMKPTHAQPPRVAAGAAHTGAVNSQVMPQMDRHDCTRDTRTRGLLRGTDRPAATAAAAAGGAAVVSEKGIMAPNRQQSNASRKKENKNRAQHEAN